MRNATWYLVTEVRWPGGVACGHGVQRLVAAAVVVLRVEEEEHERLLTVRIVQNDELRCRYVLRSPTAFDLA